MPNSIVKSFAEKSGRSVKQVEKLWKAAVDNVKKHYKIDESSKKFYPRVVNILKKYLHLDEEFSIGIGAFGGDAGYNATPEESGVFANKLGAVQRRSKDYSNFAKRFIS